jgi:Domain of unkown function (DUF1775)
LNDPPPGSELPVVRHLVKARRAGVLIIAATAGALAAAGPAMADVSVSPPSAPQTTGANLTFHVTNTGKSAMTKVTVALPADTAVAEIYPLSVPDWAPAIAQKHLATPLDTIHGGTPVTDATSSITWVAMPGKALAPGAAADLSVALGPLPTTTSLSFMVTATYADGRPGPAIPPAVLKLSPATAEEAAAAHAGHDPAAGTDTATDPDAALFAQTVAQADSGPSWWSILGWVAAAGLAAIAIVMIMRNRRRPEAADDEDGETPDEPVVAQKEDGQKEDGQKKDGENEDGENEPVAAGKVRVSSWRYNDGADDS